MDRWYSYKGVALFGLQPGGQAEHTVVWRAIARTAQTARRDAIAAMGEEPDLLRVDEVFEVSAFESRLLSRETSPVGA